MPKEGIRLDSMLGADGTPQQKKESRARGNARVARNKKGRSEVRLASVLAKRKEKWNADKKEEDGRTDC